MGYYMRFIVTDEEKVSLTKLEKGIKEIDKKYLIEKDDESEGTLINDKEIYGQLTVNVPGDGLFDEEIEELIEFLEDAKDEENKPKVLNVLENAKAIFCIQVLNQGRDSEQTFEKIDPLWNWFFENHKGLLQADMEGYFDPSNELILEVE